MRKKNSNNNKKKRNNRNKERKKKEVRKRKSYLLTIYIWFHVQLCRTQPPLAIMITRKIEERSFKNAIKLEKIYYYFFKQKTYKNLL